MTTVHSFEVTGPDEPWHDDPIEIMLGDIVVYTIPHLSFRNVRERDEYAINEFAQALADALRKEPS